MNLPRVTSIIRPISPYNDMDGDMDFYMARGTAVHEACELLDGGGDGTGLDEDSLDDIVRPYVLDYKQFLREVKPKILAIELEVTSKFGYAGRLDRVVNIGRDTGILDIKTGQNLVQMTQVQLGAYFNAFYEHEKIRPGKNYKAWAVLLTGNGYKLKEYDPLEGFKVFMSLLTIHNWRNKYGC